MQVQNFLLERIFYYSLVALNLIQFCSGKNIKKKKKEKQSKTSTHKKALLVSAYTNQESNVCHMVVYKGTVLSHGSCRLPMRIEIFSNCVG